MNYYIDTTDYGPYELDIKPDWREPEYISYANNYYQNTAEPDTRSLILNNLQTYEKPREEYRVNNDDKFANLRAIHTMVGLAKAMKTYNIQPPNGIVYNSQNKNGLTTPSVPDKSVYNINGISFDGISLHRTGYITEDEMFGFSMLNNISDENIEVYFRNVNLIGADGGDNISLMVYNNTHMIAILPLTLIRNYSSTETGYKYEDCTSQPIVSGDDTYAPINLPFSFPFYNKTYNILYVGTNGYITFDGGTYRYWDIPNMLKTTKMIAVNSGDLITTSYLCVHDDHVTIRWVGKHYGASDSIDVETMVYGDGSIEINMKNDGTWNGITGVSNGNNNYITVVPKNQVSYLLTPSL